jgi:arsenate reductase-like glutaredoxin family protein
LRAKKFEVVERDFFKEPFTKVELSKLIGDRPIAEFISTRAKAYPATGWDKKSPTKKQAIAAMIKEPTLLRRPILVVGKRYIIGWSQKEYAKLNV